ncbi:MAG: heparinase II/III family protein, partial [Thermoguttaceae bacterium]|nr:heparinase II/III family protein [Thermoguttaceae bacterium]
VGFKAGGNAVNHSHLELGAFILNHDSVRWAVDLGADNYNLPGYFGKKRWTYYRLATRGQNTLCVDGMNQNTKAACAIEDFTSTPATGSAWTDLTQAYAGQLAYARRKVSLDREKSCVTFRDEIGPGTESTLGKPLVWHFHTRAKIEISPDGKTAVLTQNAGKEEKKLRVSLEKCTSADARFEDLATTQGPDENPNSGIRRLAVKVPVTDAPQEIEVRFSGNQP